MMFMVFSLCLTAFAVGLLIAPLSRAGLMLASPKMANQLGVQLPVVQFDPAFCCGARRSTRVPGAEWLRLSASFRSIVLTCFDPSLVSGVSPLALLRNFSSDRKSVVVSPFWTRELVGLCHDARRMRHPFARTSAPRNTI